MSQKCERYQSIDISFLPNFLKFPSRSDLQTSTEIDKIKYYTKL